MKGKFYYASTFNLFEPHDNKGAALARKIIPSIEDLTGDKCTSRWAWSTDHEVADNRQVMATTDIIDLAQSDYCLFVPITKSSRGCHVEMGLALALDKPSYLYRPFNIGHTAFDTLMREMPLTWKRIISNAINENNVDVKG